MKNQQFEWENYGSDFRLKFLNTIANGRKVFKEIIDENLFFEEFLSRQKETIQAYKNVDSLLKEVRLDTGCNFEQLKKEPSIYCSYRLGAFMTIPILLKENGVDIVVMISKESYGKVLSLLEKNGLENYFEFIVINTPKGFRQAVSARKKGKSFFCLMDVGTGIQEDRTNNKNLTTINLNEAKIETMIGIPYLSYSLQMPLIPIFSYYDTNEKVTIECKTAIPRDIATDRFEFGHKATALMWGIFEKYLNQFNTQWESLSYLHYHFISSPSTENKNIRIESDQPLRFNQEDFDFFFQENKYYAYDFLRSKTIQISNYVYHFLNKISQDQYLLKRRHLNDFFKIETIDELLNNRLLIPIKK